MACFDCVSVYFVHNVDMLQQVNVSAVSRLDDWQIDDINFSIGLFTLKIVNPGSSKPRINVIPGYL